MSADTSPEQDISFYLQREDQAGSDEYHTRQGKLVVLTPERRVRPGLRYFSFQRQTGSPVALVGGHSTAEEQILAKIGLVAAYIQFDVPHFRNFVALRLESGVVGVTSKDLGNRHYDIATFLPGNEEFILLGEDPSQRQIRLVLWRPRRLTP